MSSGARHLYVHLPFCAHRCGYCDFVTVVGRHSQHARYVDALLTELEQKRVDVLPVLGAAPHHRDEVAVAAALRAERQVYIKVMRPGHDFRSPSRLRTARNAS